MQQLKNLTQPARHIDSGHPADPAQPTAYQIRLQGHLGPQWTDWFGGLTVTLEENGDTLLTGPVADQAILHGVFRKVRDLGMILISVTPLPQPDRSDPE
ncbi:MAG: hypothetical protein R3A44_28985 [Caldilineaceae bacterium]